jgi:hypothetical protein
MGDQFSLGLVHETVTYLPDTEAEAFVGAGA